MMRGFFFPLLVVLAIAGLVFGLGATAYQTGLTQGFSMPVYQPAADGQAPTVPYGYYGGMPGWRPFGFGWFGPLGCLVPLFFLFLFFILLRGPFWYHRHGWRSPGYPHEQQGGSVGPGSPGAKGDWRSGMQSMFDEFHRRAHEQPYDQPYGEQTRGEAGDQPVEE